MKSTFLVVFLFLSLVVVLITGASLKQTRGHKERRRYPHEEDPSSLIKLPQTLSTSATRNGPSSRSLANDPAYNMVSTDPSHVGYILDNRIYYHRIPHERLVLRYQDIRSINGLRPHVLESIRPFFPFFVDY